MDIKQMIEEVGDIKIKDGSFLGYNKKFSELSQYALNCKEILDIVFTNNDIIKNVIECSPECCPLCKKGSHCDSSTEYCKEYHLENIDRILQNLKKQES